MRLLAPLAVALLLAGCGSSEPTAKPAPKPSTSVAPEALRLTVTPTLARGALLVAYEVINSGTTDMVLNDRIPVDSESASGPSQVDPRKAFVYGEGDVTVVAKRTFGQKPAPAGPDHSVYFQGTVLKAGATVRGQALVPLPFADDVPSFAQDAPGSVPGSGGRWKFCVGVTPTVYQPDVLPDGTHALVSNNLAKGPRAQRLLCSETQTLSGS